MMQALKKAKFQKEGALLKGAFFFKPIKSF